MEIPKLEFRYPEPGDPEYGTAASHYELKALVAWAAKVTEYLEEVESRLRPPVALGHEAPESEAAHPNPDVAPSAMRPRRPGSPR